MTDERPFPHGSRVDDLDLSSFPLHGANLEGAKLTDAFLCGAEIRATSKAYDSTASRSSCSCRPNSIAASLSG